MKKNILPTFSIDLILFNVSIHSALYYSNIRIITITCSDSSIRFLPNDAKVECSVECTDYN